MTVQLNHIIAAFDGSEGSLKALDLAIKLHKGFLESRLTILHVYNQKLDRRVIGNAPIPGLASDNFYVDSLQTMPVINIGPTNFDQPQQTEDIVEDSVTWAESKVKQLLRDNHTDGVFKVLEGVPAESICDYAEKTNADLIIVGNSGKSGLEKFFIGSTSNAIAKNSPCAVLIAK